MKTIYKNGAVYTGKLPLVEAFAVEDGKFVFAGSKMCIRDRKIIIRPPVMAIRTAPMAMQIFP